MVPALAEVARTVAAAVVTAMSSAAVAVARRTRAGGIVMCWLLGTEGPDQRPDRVDAVVRERGGSRAGAPDCCERCRRRHAGPVGRWPDESPMNNPAQATGHGSM
ncbi:hypothetical protein Cs7R123_10580 [Catellatospora sp. TT07R-123]|nr:hypothetical protein Cs7R123_10580 [Catellatospora sp. TT07R-123]